MITNFKINQPFTSNFSVEEGEKSSCTRDHGAGRIFNHVETFFFAEARKVSERKTIQSRHCESQLVPGWVDFLSGSLQRKPFSIIWDKVFTPANEALDPSLKDLSRQGLISFRKHSVHISAKTLKS